MPGPSNTTTFQYTHTGWPCMQAIGKVVYSPSSC